MSGKLQSIGSVVGKETIYVDVDDEITAVIDKVQNAKSKIIALVLPKRATVLQSIVNMKLLKRTAENANKNLVLVTSEAGLMPLAGAVGLHVASTPTSKPSIPSAPALPGDEPEDVEAPLNIVDGTADETDDDFDPDAAATKSVGELAASGVASALKPQDVDESIDMAADEDSIGANKGGEQPTTKLKKNKKLRVPNFDSFRKKLALAAVVLLVVVGGLIYSLTALPHAEITIHTNNSSIATNVNYTIDTGTKALNTDNKIAPAIAQTQQKTSTQQVPASGQQNNGEKAVGTVKFTAQKCTQPIGAPPAALQTGSSVSSGGKTYILQDDVTYSFSGFTQGGTCANYTSNTANIQALKGGADYNTSAGATFAASGGASGTGAAAGGTDNITKIVTQGDIDGATAKMTSATDTTAVKQQLVSGLQGKNAVAVPTTFQSGDPQVTTSAKAGDAADTVTVTSVVTYTMFGVQKSDLTAIVEKNVNSRIEKGKQVILDNGVANAKFTQSNPSTTTGANVGISVQSIAGPQLDANALKSQLAGKKKSEVRTYISQTPGVKSVDVKMGPFWVETVPGKVAKVKVTIVKSND